jgi:hypothetical protein
MRSGALTAMLVFVILAALLGGAFLLFSTSTSTDPNPAAPYEFPMATPFDPDATPSDYPVESFDVTADPVNSPDAYVPRGEPTPQPLPNPNETATDNPVEDSQQ